MPEQPTPITTSNKPTVSRRLFQLTLTCGNIRAVDMLAILYSGAFGRAHTFWERDRAQTSWLQHAYFPWAFSLAFAALGLLIQAEPVPASVTFAARAEQLFQTNRIRFQTEKTNATAAWQFGRACFDWAEFARSDEQRERIANEGIAACRQAVALQPDWAASHYYLALNLGQLARTKSLGALKIIPEIEREFKSALELDPQFNNAAPHRSIGLLYLQAPGWPTSIGNRSKARFHLKKAVELSPEYPENRLCLIEAFLQWNEKKNFMPEVKAVEELWPRARQLFAGKAWEADWADWDKRWNLIQKTIKQKAT